MAVDVIIDPSSGQIYWNDQAGAGTQTIAISGNATNAINVVGYSNFFSAGGGGLGTQILATFTDSPTSTFTPGTNAYDLGSSSLRWNFYGTGGNFTGAISTSSSTASTSSTTGALTVSGGAGIALTSYFGQDVKILGTTASTGFSTGALVVTGGVGIGGSLYTVTTSRSSISGVNFNNSRAENGFTINASSSYTFNIQDAANNQRLNYHADSNRTEFTGNNATHEIRLINSNNSSYTGFKANSSGTVTYTLPAGDGSNGQVLYTNGSAGLAWTTPGAAGGGGSGVQTGAQYEVAFYTATGSSVAGSSTFKNDTAAAKVTITHTTASTSTTTGALVISGGVGIAGSIWSGQHIVTDTTVSSSTSTGAMLVFGGLGVSGQINAASLQTSGNAVISGNLTFNGVGVFGNATSDTINSLARYISDILPSTDNSYDLGNNSLGWRNFRVSGVGTIASLAVTSSTASTNTSTGALVVTGGVGIGGSLWTSTSNLASVSGVTLNNGTITGTLSGTATSAQVLATTTDTSSTLYLLGSRSSTGFAGTAVYVDTNISFSGSTITASLTGTATTATAAIGVNVSNASTNSTHYIRFSPTATGTGLATSTNTSLTYNPSTNILSATTFSGSFSGSLTGTASIATSSVNSATTTDTTSTLYLLGSRSSTGFAGTALYVDSSISILGSQITAGVWGGTAISAVNGGTGQNTYTIGDILYASSTTVLSKLSAGTAASVLTSNGAGTAPSWKAAASGGSPAGSSSWLQYNNSGAFGATSHLAYNGNINNDFVISAPYSGATQGQVNIGLGITGFDGVTLGKFAGSASGTVIAANQASGFTGNFADFQLAGSSKFTIGFDGKITVVGVYSLPTTAGTAGSVLTSNGTGNQFYWSAPGAAGGGAGTVASGTANQVAIYAATGASVSGAANFTYSTSSVTITNTTASNNNSSGALLVHGGIGASGQISGAGASFTSTVFLNGIRIGQGGNNITFTDSAGTTIGSFNTSNGWLKSDQTTQSTTSGTGALVSAGGLGVAKAASIGETVYALSTVNSTSLTTGALVVSGGAGFAKTMFVGDNINIFKSGSVGALRLWNSAQSFYTAFQAGAPVANTTYTLPIAFPGSGTSVLASDTSGIMSWIASGGGSGTVTTLTAGNGITFSTGTTITTTGTIRRRTSYNLVFMSGYTPNVSGVDTVVLRVPDSAADAASVVYNCREVIMRVETANAGTSTINIQKYGIATGTGTSLYSTTSTGSTTNILSAALSITGATTYEAASTTFAAGHGTCATGDKLRVNFTALNASHTSFTISLLIEEQ